MEQSDVISDLCHYSKNLWNEANYIIRQEFFNNHKYVKYCTLAGNLKTSPNFKALNGQTAQQTLRILDRSWKAFFAAIKEWTDHPDKFLGRPKLPGYKPKDGEFMLVFTNQQVSIRDGYLVFPKKLSITIKTRLEDDTNIREVRIIPKGTGYVCEIVYEKPQAQEGEAVAEPKDRAPDRIIGLDFGTVNVVTISNNIGVKPIAIKDDGTGIKSINQFYNRKIKDAMHKISKFIIDYCIRSNVGTIVIGYNDNWKQMADLGKRNNQNFVSIPYYLLTRMIQYKSEDVGITVKLQEESHTSKCSFLDNEPIEHHETYVGKRISRGLFRSAKGIIINADVNGSCNIIRKSEPKAFDKSKADGVGGCGLHPVRVNPLKITGSNIL